MLRKHTASSNFSKYVIKKVCVLIIGVARIFDWGGPNLKNSAVFTEIESDFSAEIGNSNDVSAQIQVISKKKKKKRSSPKLRVNFQPKSEIRTIFPPKFRWSPKNKKNKKK